MKKQVKPASGADTPARVEAELGRYVDLYDFAPVGYFVLDCCGTILQANRTGAVMLGVERSKLVNRRLGFLVAEGSRPAFEAFLEKVLAGQTANSCKAVIPRADREPIAVEIRATCDDGKNCRVVMTDIASRAQAEEVLQARTRVSEYAVDRTLGEVLTKALDEAERLTGSQIGFFHFVEADQKTLSLQQWSTNTLRNMCTAEGRGSHYSADKAGVWVDALHQRRAVIHNDYTSLGHRKGVPPGHAPVVRELVVPILRGGQIVGLMGVGNKPDDYEARDVAVVQMLADLTWDIVERIRAEKAFRDREERLRLALQGADLGSWDWNVVTGSVAFNERWAAMLGYSLAEIEPHVRTWEEMIHPDDRARVQEVLARHLNGQTPGYEMEHRLRHKSGDWVWVLDKGAVIERDAAGQPVRMCGTHLDITHRKRAEEAIRKSEGRLRRFYESGMLGAIYWNVDGRVVDANDRFLEMVGYTREELDAGKIDWAQMTPPEYRHLDETAIREVQAKGANRTAYEKEYIRKDGTRTPILIAGASLDQEHGVGIAFVLDISDHKRAEESLKRAHAQLSLAQQSAGAGMWDWDMIGGTVQWSPELFGLFGLDPATTPATLEAWRNIIYPEDREVVEQRLQDAIRNHSRLESEYRIVLPSGETRWVAAWGDTSYDSGRPVRMAGICMDVTARKQAEERSGTVLKTAMDGFWVVDAGGHILEANDALCEMTGYTRKELLKLPLDDLEAVESPEETAEHIRRIMVAGEDRFESRHRRKDGRIIDVEITATYTGDPAKQIYSFVRDISKHKEYQREQEATIAILRLAGVPGPANELIRAVTGFLQEWSGCEAVGVRLRDGDDYPYFETRGFPVEFVKAESHLCAADEAGNALRDSMGNPVLECMCGNVLCGRFDPSKPFFTAGGSFWSNCTTDLLASTTEADRQGRTRNRCNGEGYESVALIPLRAGGTTFGLLQFNDHRKDRFSPSLIEMLERLANSVAMALAKRQVEQVLRGSEKMYRSLFDNMLNGFASCQMHFDEGGKPCDFTFLAVNAAFESLSGLKNVVGKKASEIIPGIRESSPELFELYGRVSQTGIPDRVEVFVKALQMWFWISVYSLRRGYFVTIFDEITEHKRLEEAQLFLAQTSGGTQAEPFFRALARYLAQSLDAYFICIDRLEGDGLMARTVAVWCGDHFEDNVTYALKDTPCGDVVGKTVCCFPDNVCRFFPRDKVLQDLQAESYIGVTLWSHTGQPIGLIAVIGRSPLTNRLLAEAILKTVAVRAAGEMERLIAEEEKERLRAQLLQAQKMEAVGQLAGGVAHDFRNQLQVIQGFGEMLLRRNLVKEEGREPLSHILRAAERSAATTGQLLAYSRREMLQMTVRPVGECLASVVKILPHMIGEDIRLIVRPSSEEAMIRIDAHLFQQAIFNLATNARDAMPGGGSLTIEATCVTLDEAQSRQIDPELAKGQYVIVSATDTGGGIDEATLARVFDPFFTTKGVGRGTGLGLPMVYGFAKQSGGAVGIQSVPGRGTTVTLYFPRIVSGPGEEESPKEAKTLHGGNETVLLVEDEVPVLLVAGDLLREAGYRVLTAASGEEALSLVERHEGSVDLLVTDIVMPGMSGVALAERLCGRYPNLGVVFISGYPGEELSRRGVNGSTETLAKPFTSESLLSKLRHALDSRETAAGDERQDKEP